MEFKVEATSPDGVSVSVKNIYLDTLDDVHKFMIFCVEAWGAKKIDVEECKKLLEDSYEH